MQQLRIEKKFEIDERTSYRFEHWLNCNSNFKNHYPARQVSSIYFDTPDRRSLADNIIGLSKRQKLRFRWYRDSAGVHQQTNNIQAELKFKENTVGGKNILVLTEAQKNEIKASNFKLMPHFLDMLRDKINLPMYFYTAYPFLHCRYLREYYVDSFGLRLTVDRNIRFSDQFNHSDRKINWYDYPKQIIEVKFPDYLQSHASRVLRNLPLRSVRNSKYVLGCAMLGDAIYM